MRQSWRVFASAPVTQSWRSPLAAALPGVCSCRPLRSPESSAAAQSLHQQQDDDHADAEATAPDGDPPARRRHRGRARPAPARDRACESSRNDITQPAVREAWGTRGVYGPLCEWRDLGRGGLPRCARAPRGREPAHQRRRGLGRRARAGRGTRARRPAARLARPAARRPVHGQGSDRRHALRDDLRLARVRRQRARRPTPPASRACAGPGPC